MNDNYNVVGSNPHIQRDTLLNLKELLKVAQGEKFGQELDHLTAGNPVSTKSSVYKLLPFLDDDGLIRLKTRLEMTNTLPYDTKYPILLPKDHALTKLIILEYHEKTQHAYGSNYILWRFNVQFLSPLQL